MVVCDGGSTDGTSEALAALRTTMPEIVLLRHPQNLGIPQTMRELYERAAGEWIYFAPADGQVPARALEIMWPARQGAALVVGQRIPRRDPRSRVLIARASSARTSSSRSRASTTSSPTSRRSPTDPFGAEPYPGDDPVIVARETTVAGQRHTTEPMPFELHQSRARRCRPMRRIPLKRSSALIV